MSESLEYGDVSAEMRGVMTPGRLKFTDAQIVFKNTKTGKVEQIAADDIELINSQKFVGNWGVRVFTKNGTLHRFAGFKDSDHEKLAKFIKKAYGQDMVEKEMCVKGWNWGTARFMGSVLSLDMDTKTIFEVPLSHVSQCMTGKNEVTMEFHQSDDAAVGLLEMRFHIPSVETADEDPVESFQNNVMSKASVISASGDAITIFREIHCLTPRGRYDIKIFSTFFQLHGKTFDYKIPMDSVLRLFLLPHKDNRQMFFVLSLDPPIKQGQTRYHFLVLLFGPEEECSIELPFSEAELKEKYDGKLESYLAGPLYEVMGKVMKVLIGRKITGPGNFVGHSGTAAVGCSFKAAAGYLYPLERGFIYIHKPPIHIRFEEIASVNFARSGGSTRSFDFEITLKNGTVHTFSSIEKEEYAKLFDFIQQKKLHVSNMGKDKGGYKDVDFGDSDNENEPDAYLARVKAEAREKESDDDDEGSEEESTDEDFKPNENESDVADEYDSNVQSESTDDSEAGSGGGAGGDSGGEKKKKQKKEKKEMEKKERKERTKKPNKKKDSNKPKRAATAFMLWLNDTREQIKKDNPGISVTEIAKRGGELWKELKDKTKWEERAAKDRQRYQDEMKTYKPSAADSDDKGGSKSVKASSGKSAQKRKKESPVKKSANTSGGSFKSKEYISDDDLSSSDGDNKKKKEAASSGTNKGPEKKKSKSAPKASMSESKSKKASSDDDDDEDEEDDSDSGASDDDDDDGSD